MTVDDRATLLEVGPYELVTEVGRGSMGVVYRGRHRDGGEEVAVKVLSDSRLADPNILSRFRREARIEAAIAHPNVTGFRDFGEATVRDPSRPPGSRMRVIYLVMEWIPGQDLVATLASGPLDLREVRSIGIQVADALDAAHQVGVIHRDLKPANIRLTPDRRVKVLDFGLAKILEDAEMQQGRPPTFRTTVGSLLGTAPYMSPEQLFGRDLDTRSDLFSLGVVLYEMATGELPFQGKNIVLMLQAISRQEPRPPRALRPQASPALERVILKLLAKDPDGRYPSAAAAAEALRATPEPA